MIKFVDGESSVNKKFIISDGDFFTKDINDLEL